MAGSGAISTIAGRVRRFVVHDDAWAWFGFAFIGYFLRRPGGLTHAEFAYEDGKVFYLGSWFGGALDQVFRPYAGYLHLIPRSVGVLERQVPPAWAPFVGNLVALLIAALVVRFVASRRLEAAIPDRRIRWACAALLIVLPGMDMILGSITFIQFYLAVFLIAGALAGPASTLVGAALTRASLLAAALTGPFAILFLPMYLVRLGIRRDRDALWSAAMVGGGAAIQFGALLVAGARGAAAPTLWPFDVIRVLGVHLLTGFSGTRLMTELVARRPDPIIAIGAIAVIAVLVVLSLRSVPRSWLLVAGYVAAATIGSFLLNGSDSTETLLDPLSASRYFVIPWFVLGVLLIASAARHNVAAMVLLAVLAVGVIGDSRLPSGWDYGWKAASNCIGGPDPCDVRIFPGIPYWDLSWPGLAATQTGRGP